MPIYCVNCNTQKGNIPALINKWHQCKECGRMFCPDCGKKLDVWDPKQPHRRKCSVCGKMTDTIG